MKICVTFERMVEPALRNALGLDDTGNYHNANSGMKAANVLHEFNNRFAGIDYRIYKDHCELSLQMVELDVVSIAGMDEHGEWEGVVDAKSHRLSAAHQRHNRCLLLVKKLIA